jgi:anti-sigma regulatory factor (Ser/Thr protein kinase)
MLMAPVPAPERETFPAKPGTPRLMRQVLRNRAANDGVPSAAVGDLALAVTEAANNALRHTTTPTIELTWRVCNQRVEVEVRDGGIFRHELPIPPTGRPGWGLRLMAAMADELALHPGTAEEPGTSVRLLKSLPAERR